MSRFFALLSLTLRDASKSRIILALIITSLAICSVAVLATTAILDGFKITLQNGAINADGELIINGEGAPYTPIKDLPRVTAELGKHPNIKNFSIRSWATGGIKSGDSYVGAYAFLGFTPVYEANVTKLQDSLIEGEFFAHNSTENELVLGLSLADALVDLEDDGKRLKAGDEIDVASIGGKVEKFRVAGVIDAKNFKPNWMAFFDKQVLDKMDPSGKDSEIVIKLKDFAQLDQTKKDLDKLELDVRVATWQQKAGYIEGILDAVAFITDMISKMMIVAIFIILSIIVYINVNQKKRQIGIIKSMGASNSFVVMIFIYESLIYSILSFSIGVLLFFLVHLYSEANPIALPIGDFQTAVNKENIIWTIGTLFIAALGGSFTPAYIAAKTTIANVIAERN